MSVDHLVIYYYNFLAKYNIIGLFYEIRWLIDIFEFQRLIIKKTMPVNFNDTKSYKIALMKHLNFEN